MGIGTIILFFLSLGSSAFAGEIPATLKKREPNWRVVTSETYPDGIPKTILFLEPEKGGSNEILVKIIENYPDGTPRAEADINENKLPDGIIKLFAPDGSLKTVYTVKNGILHGPKVSLSEKAHYADGKLHGKVEKYENGVTVAEFHYEHGVLDGEYVEWNPDGSVKERLYYIGGVQCNAQKFPNREMVPFKPMEETFELPVSVIEIEEEKPLEPLDGEQYIYYKDGSKQALLTYKNGVLDGKKILWDTNGEVLEEAFYKDGDLEGRYYVRRPNGQEVISHYKNNRLYGLTQVYYPIHPTFGRVKAFEANYVNGLVEGEAAEYNEAGTKISSTFYQNGKKEGIATLYTHDGKVRITAAFKNDEQEGIAREYYPNGLLAKEACFQNSMRHGEESTYFENGQIRTLYYVKANKLHGPGKEWNSEGTLVFEGTYDEGKKNGVFKKYDANGALKSHKTYENNVLKEKIQ